MIRINLLTLERKTSRSAGRSVLIGQKITVAGSLILLLTAALVGWRYWALDQSQQALDREIAAKRREESRLSEILKQVADFEAQREQLQQRVSLIDELRRGQTAPVHILDQVSRALPDMMWLTGLRQEGYDITIEGRCMTLTALSDFVGNLEASRYFKRPVEIVNSEVTSAGREGPELITFTIKGTFQMAGIDPPAAAAGGASKKAPAKAPAKKGGARG